VEKVTKSGIDQSKYYRLLMKNSATGKVKTIHDGRMGIHIDHGFILPEIHTVMYTWEDWLSDDGDGKVYLCACNYEKDVFLRDKILIFEPKKYSNKPPYLGGPSLDGIDLCDNNTSLCTRIRYEKAAVRDCAWDFNIIHLKTGDRRTVDETKYRELVTNSHSNSPVRYVYPIGATIYIATQTLAKPSMIVG
jgi:hypothetical protein